MQTTSKNIFDFFLFVICSLFYTCARLMHLFFHAFACTSGNFPFAFITISFDCIIISHRHLSFSWIDPFKLYEHQICKRCTVVVDVSPSHVIISISTNKTDFGGCRRLSFYFSFSHFTLLLDCSWYHFAVCTFVCANKRAIISCILFSVSIDSFETYELCLTPVCIAQSQTNN